MPEPFLQPLILAAHLAGYVGVGALLVSPLVAVGVAGWAVARQPTLLRRAVVILVVGVLAAAAIRAFRLVLVAARAAPD